MNKEIKKIEKINKHVQEIEDEGKKAFWEIKDVEGLKNRLKIKSSGDLEQRPNKKNKNEKDLSSKQTAISEELIGSVNVEELSLEEINSLSPEDLAGYKLKLLKEDKKLEKRQSEIVKEIGENKLSEEVNELGSELEKKEIKSELEVGLEKINKKGSFGKAIEKGKEGLAKIKERLAEKNPKLGKAFEWYSKKMNSGNKWQKLGKRILISGTIGAIAGTAGAAFTGGGLVLAGAVGGGLALKRVVASFVAGAGAGLLHKKLTKKGLEKKIEVKSLDPYFREFEKKGVLLDKDLGSIARDRVLIKRLRKENLDETISKEDKFKLKTIEEIRNRRVEDIKTLTKEIRDQRDELKRKLVAKNERNNAIVAGVTGLITGLSFRYGADVLDNIGNIGVSDLDNVEDIILDKEGVTTLVDNNELKTGSDNTSNELETATNDAEKIVSEVNDTEEIKSEAGEIETGTSDVSESTNTSEVTDDTETVDETNDLEEPGIENIPESAYIQKGDGITQILKRQLDANPELAKKFGITNGSGVEYAELAKKLGYLNDDYEVRLRLDTDKGYFATLDENGKPTVLEVDKSGEITETNFIGREFEGENIEREYEYLKKTSGVVEVDATSAELEGGRIGDLDLDGKTEINLSGTELVSDGSKEIDNSGIDLSQTEDLEGGHIGEIDLSGTEDISGLDDGVYDNYADEYSLIEGDPREIGDKLSYPPHSYRVKLDHGVIATVEYNDNETLIDTVTYKYFDGQKYNLMLDSNGDGNIDRYIQKNTDLPFEGFKNMDINNLKDNPELLATKGFDGNTNTYMIDFSNKNGVENMTIISGSDVEDDFNSRQISNMKNSILRRFYIK